MTHRPRRTLAPGDLVEQDEKSYEDTTFERTPTSASSWEGQRGDTARHAAGLLGRPWWSACRSAMLISGS
jgi:hypothetical protein